MDPITGKIAMGPGLSGPAAPTPSVCRMVHYQSYGTPNGEYLPEPRAAIITEVHYVDDGDDVAPDVPDVALCVLNPTGLFFNPRVRYADAPTPGCWNWPPRA